MKCNSNIENEADTIDNKRAIAVNLISGLESEKIFAAFMDDNPRFMLLWFTKMVEQLSDHNDYEGLTVLVLSLYESLDLEVPQNVRLIIENKLIAQFLVELIDDLAEISSEEFETDT